MSAGGGRGGGHGGGHGGGRRKRRGGHHEEEHENHERWLVSYADMMTLLMALFLVMFAMSTIDKVKFEQLAHGLAAGFGEPAYVPLDGGDRVLDTGGDVPDPVELQSIAVAPVDQETRDLAETLAGQDDRAEQAAEAEAARAELERLRALEGEVEAALAGQGLADRADYRIDERGLVVALVTDDVFFDNASAVIRDGGLAVLDAVAPAVAASGRAVDVEGHANHLPVAPGGAYPSNWELSAARAGSVVRHLIEVDGIPPGRLTAVGYADTRPVVPPEDPAALERNRRVDLVVLSDQPADVRGLLPALAEA